MARREIDLGLEGEGDALARQVDLHDGGLDFLADLEEFSGVLHEVVADLADVDQSVLMDADVDEGAEGGDIRHDAGEFHARLEILHLLDAVGEAEGLELLARIAPGLGELCDDVLEGGKPDLRGDIAFGLDGGPLGGIPQEILHRAAEIRGHAVDEFVALGMDGAGIERVGAVADAQEAR